MPLSPEILNRIAQFRAKSLDKTITIEELREAIIMMRQDRVTAQNVASTTRASKAKKPTQSVADMEAELGLL